MKKTVLIFAAASAVASAFAESVSFANLKQIRLYGNPSVVTNVTFDGLARSADVSNIVEDALSRIPSADFTASNAVLVSTILETAPEPGNWTEVSNRAMSAIQTLKPATDYAAAAASRAAEDATNYTDAAISEIPEADFTEGNRVLVATILAAAPPPGDYEVVSNRAMTALQSHQSLRPAMDYADASALRAASDATNYTDLVAASKADKSQTYTRGETDERIVELSPKPGNYVEVSNRAMSAVLSLQPAIDYASRSAFDAAERATNYTDRSISHENPAFVEAVTNCQVAIGQEGSSAVGEFGTYGTIGSLLAALAAAVAWLKANKADKGEMSVTPGSGTDSDKTTIQLKAGTSASVLARHQDVSDKAPLDSPEFTGTPTAPTAPAGTSTTQVATTEFVRRVVGDIDAVLDAINGEEA